MWEVRDAEEGEVHPSVRERERGEWDTAAGLVGLSLRKPPKCKRLTAKTRGQASFLYLDTELRQLSVSLLTPVPAA